MVEAYPWLHDLYGRWGFHGLGNLFNKSINGNGAFTPTYWSAYRFDWGLIRLFIYALPQMQDLVGLGCDLNEKTK